MTPTVTTVSDVRDQLAALPTEAFTRLQYLAPAVGCFNRCAFCSQGAGRDVWQLTEDGLTGLLTALADTADQRGLAVASGRIHRPRVVFPYLDNDIGSYPHLDAYAALARERLGVRLRVSTVGFSARSPQLTAMHQRLVADFGDVFDGIRFSVTPYTWGFADRGPGMSRAAYVEDLAAALRVYRPLLDHLGHGAASAACELRFAPLLGLSELTDTTVDGRRVLACGPHLLIAREQGGEVLPETVIERLDEHTQPVFSRPGTVFLHVVSDHVAPTAETVRTALAGTLAVPHRSEWVRVHRFANADGPYYAADPDFHPDGTFTALHLYPKTALRKAAGYTDATRWFLNTLLAHKQAHGLERRAEFHDATGHDVDAVLAALLDEAQALKETDATAAEHLRTSVHPQVAAYASALERAGYPPSTFFSRRFTIDTGQIVNQGRAKALLRGLAATDGEPMTPREERGFGQVSLSTVRGPIWRITPLPLSRAGHLPISVAGLKNPATTSPSLLVEELDPCHLSPVMRTTGCRLRRHVLTLPSGWIEHVDLTTGRAAHLLPGLATAA
ncbi:hypothetical protein [Streptomyces alanosinicus]|uniref:Radical SAM protein n=1 Tax=Streptomyces alanosinicus TaxID=68171 RepID=A0A919D7V2_9ACTN|nr:hypothetical protein [Streptomyces alanosinicus]GHE14811.1 hypothetical protein GCM10010339_87420 [Streptomyces alanosinicus]